MAALLTTSSDSTDDVVKYIREARAQDIEVLPPDINVSMRHFTVDYDENADKKSIGKIRFGLSAVKGLGDAALEAIIATRDQQGPSKSIYKFCEQVVSSKVNKKVLEALIKSGSMDTFERPRKQLMMVIDKALSRAQKIQKDKSLGQTNMFNMFSTQASDETLEEYPDTKEFASKEKLQFEKDAVGFYLSGHPLDPYEKLSRQLGAVPSQQLINARHLEEVSVMGVVSELKERPLKSGKGRWAVVILEDSFGQAEVLCFSKSYEDAEQLLKTKEPLLVSGRALIDDLDDDTKQQKPKMRLQSVRLLADAELDRVSHLTIDLKQATVDERSLSAIKQALNAYPGGKPVILNLVLKPDLEIRMKLNRSNNVRPTDDLLNKIEQSIEHVKVFKE